MGCLNDRSRIATFFEKLAHFFRFVRKIRVITAQTSESKKPNFRVSLPHRRSTTVSLETNSLYSFVVKTLRPLIPSKHFSIHRFLTPRPKTTMPSLKKLTKELRQEIVSYLFPFPPCTTNLAFRLATLIFAKTRFCSHINFIGRCLQSKVIPKGFRSNFHASSFSRSNQYLYQIQCAQNSFYVTL